MAEWRPEEGWDEQAKRRLKDLDFDAMTACLENHEYYRNIYEAGADAKLTALRATAEPREWVKGDVKGDWVFIPDAPDLLNPTPRDILGQPIQGMMTSDARKRLEEK